MNTVTCDECGVEYAVGDWPLCASKSNPGGHAPPIKVPPFIPYVDNHISTDGKPVRVESLAHKWRLMKQNKVDYPAVKRGMPGQEF